MMENRIRKQRRGWLVSYLWSAPSLLLIALIVVFPILYTFFISLTNMNVYHWFDFTVIGLDNYVKALFVFDSGFLSALLSTLLWTIVNMAVQLVLAFVLASLLNIQKLRLRKLYKTLLTPQAPRWAWRRRASRSRSRTCPRRRTAARR